MPVTEPVTTVETALGYQLASVPFVPWAGLHHGADIASYAGLVTRWTGLHRRVHYDGVTPPCLEMGPGVLRLLWPVTAGTRALSIWCKHSGHTPRPRVRVLPNPDIGITTEVTVEAEAVPDWHQLQVSVAPVADGVLEVWLEVRAWEGAAWARWDKVEVS
jgi:hypothetical protein